MPKIDPSAVPEQRGTRYPEPFDAPCLARSWRRLGEGAGLTQFGVNLLRLEPGSWSSQRHWHSHEDEFVYVLHGTVVLVENRGEVILQAGECAGFKAGSEDGHCLQNRSGEPVELLVVGSRVPGDHGEYPDIDLAFTADDRFVHKDGTPYPIRPRHD
jgi:uncharacterized cupin superfamily protein